MSAEPDTGTLDAPVALDAIRECLEGTIPAMMTPCAPDGTPSITYLSQIQYVDPDHVGLSFQFFNKTRANVLANPRAEVLAVHPLTAAIYGLEMRYLRTETAGPLFETMKAKLAGVASVHGLADVFRLRGAGVCRVEAIGQVTRGDPTMPVPPRCTRHLAGLRRTPLLQSQQAREAEAEPTPREPVAAPPREAAILAGMVRTAASRRVSAHRRAASRAE